MLDALRLSVGTLTIVPSGAIAEIDRRTAARAMIIAPLAVLPLAITVALVGWLGRTAGLPALAVGLLVVGGLALGSRALHLDGLADTVDGFGSGMDRGTFLDGDAARRRRAHGCGGADCRDRPAGRGCRRAGPRSGRCRCWSVWWCAALGRHCVSPAYAACRLPGGDGLGVAVAGSVPRAAAAGCWLVVLLIMIGAAWLSGHYPASGALATVAAALLVASLVYRCVRRLGGVTGDVMGAAIEIAFTVMIVVMII